MLYCVCERGAEMRGRTPKAWRWGRHKWNTTLNYIEIDPWAQLRRKALWENKQTNKEIVPGPRTPLYFRPFSSQVLCLQFDCVSNFTLFASQKDAEKKSPVISSNHCVPSNVPHSGFGTLDLENLDAEGVLPLIPTYPIKLVCGSRPLFAQHPSLMQRTRMMNQIELDREVLLVYKLLSV